MSDDIFAAYERALELVGVPVWEKLSDLLRARILDAELSALIAERDLIGPLQPVARTGGSD
jgi:hypothetical protein